MSVRMMTAVWDLPLPPSEKLVLLALADWARDDGRCWPSIKSVAEKSGVSERTVQRMLRDAEKSGILTRKEVVGKGCEYRLHPRHGDTPDNMTRVTNDAGTPDTVSPNTLGTVTGSEAKASSPSRAKQSEWQPLPIGWIPTRPLSAATQTMVDGWPPGAVQSELESFRSWAGNAEPKKGKGLKKDWDDAFGNWIRTAHRDRYARLARMERPRTNPLSEQYRAICQAAASASDEDYHGTGLALPPARYG